MEETFSERLKNYRRARNMTQQELADILGVSNKTISRWESGGYPDLGMLVPLARALGVTVDDLLDGEKPVRTLTQADWQNFLSFAFALGGGVLFFLLDLFMPVVLCYLAYLVCMIYGVYLQRHYCYQTRWFRIANGIMNLSVNLSMAYRCVTALYTLTMTASAIFSWEPLVALLTRLHWYVGGSMGVAFVLALAATAVTLYLVERPALPSARGLRLTARRPRPIECVPAACSLILLVFYMVYSTHALPLWCYQQQPLLRSCLLGAMAALCLALYLPRHRRGLVPTAILAAGGLAMSRFGRMMVYRTEFTRFSIASEVLQRQAKKYPESNWLYTEGNADTLLFAALLAAACLAVCCIGIKKKETPE